MSRRPWGTDIMMSESLFGDESTLYPLYYHVFCPELMRYNIVIEDKNIISI